jgi:molybdopterin-dependent oxidoreductase alpha subunit
MTREAPAQDVDETRLEVGKPKGWAAGIPGVAVSLARSVEQMGTGRTVKALRLLNQREGFDCPGCAWPEPREVDGEKRKLAEFCENGAKAVAEEATKRRVGREFFAKHPIRDLKTKTDYWLGQQGRITEPFVLREGATHYEPISWDDAFELVAGELKALTDPNEAIFYTSGRTSNEAAFLYQLLVRSFGTNNLPDCSNMCHESSGAALAAPTADPEAGLMRFKNPQNVRGVVGKGTPLADEFAQIRLGGDLALFQAVGHLLLAWEEQAPGTIVDRAFVEQATEGFDDYAQHLREVDWPEVERATGLPREQIERVARMIASSERTIYCWAMGLTQHKHAVPTISEIANLALMRGMIGKPGAGLCPVRGHSNVQGDRTMGIWEKMPQSFMDALATEFGISVPREHGLDTVDSIRAMRDGRGKVFFAVGGNFASATPDTDATEKALASCSLTVHVSTKLNRSHVVHGRTALVLPTLGRTERDVQAGGEQFVTVEDSMSQVHTSRGRLKPASEHLLSEVAIVCRLAEKLFGEGHAVPWRTFEGDYDLVRDRISRVVPGCADYNRRVREPDGFVLPHAPRDSREFTGTANGKGNFTVSPLEYPAVPEGRLLLQTMRSHDQYNTTIYGLSDRYRGIENARRVVLVNPDDLVSLGLTDGAMVDLVSEWRDGNRRAPAFRVVAYPTARGCAAAYFPEANALVPLDSVAEKSNTPVSKAIVVRLEPQG